MRASLKLLLLLCALVVSPLVSLPSVGSLPTTPIQAIPVSSRQGEADSFCQQGMEQYQISQYREALQSWQAALEIYREVGDRQGEASALGNLGSAYSRLGQYPQAIDFFEQYRTLAREIRHRIRETNVPSNELDNRQGEADLSVFGGSRYPDTGLFGAPGPPDTGPRVTFTPFFTLHDFNQHSPATVCRMYRSQEEANVLGNLGIPSSNLGQYRQAIDFHLRSLSVAREISDRQGEANVLSNLGIASSGLGQYRQAIEFHSQSLSIAREIGDRQGQANALGNLGNVYRSLGQYRQAIEFHRLNLAIARTISDRQGQANALGNLGNVHQSLGQYQQAIDFYEQHLVISREIGNRQGEANGLGNLGIAYDSLGQYRQAINFHDQHLAMARELSDRQGEASALGNLGFAYGNLGQYPQAIDFYEQHLTLASEIGDRQGEANALGNLGNASYSLGIYQQAIDFHQQNLTLVREIGDRQGEANALSNLGRAWQAQNQPELAIVFFKESVNTYEAIREVNRGLSGDQQASYLSTIEDDYRHLADLLLQQDRILEAQRVLDLLRVQELDTYLRGVRGTADTQAGVALRPDEQAIIDRYTANQDKLIELGREQAELAKIAPDQRTPQQQARIVELRQLEQAVLLTFQTFFQQADIATLVTRLRSTLGATNLELRELNGLRDNLQRLDQNAVVLYPLVLDDRLELVLVTPGQAPIRRTVPVTRLELNRAIGELRYALESPTRDAVTPAQQLYNWLIRPIEADLQQAQAKTIIYSPDLRLRYVPLAALHDGDNWLIESYRVNNITAASLADLNHIPNRGSLSVLAAAFTEGRYEFQVGNRTIAYNGLTHAGPEIEALARLIPGTTSRLNQAFNPSLIFEMDDYRIIHLATHAAFNPGGLENSYILFGNGEKATLADVKGWSFPNVDLVVLSACETAVGDVLRAEETLTAGGPSSAINGEEILGFGYLMQLAGADAAIGSLWKVDDGGTQILMSAFYDALSRGGLAKAAALQQAQLDLIRISEGNNRGGFELAQDLGLDPNNLAHPHYWAPFILIGNGL